MRGHAGRRPAARTLIRRPNVPQAWSCDSSNTSTGTSPDALPPRTAQSASHARARDAGARPSRSGCPATRWPDRPRRRPTRNGGGRRRARPAVLPLPNAGGADHRAPAVLVAPHERAERRRVRRLRLVRGGACRPRGRAPAIPRRAAEQRGGAGLVPPGRSHHRRRGGVRKAPRVRRGFPPRRHPRGTAQPASRARAPARGGPAPRAIGRTAAPRRPGATAKPGRWRSARAAWTPGGAAKGGGGR